MISVMDEFGNASSSLKGGLANLSDRDYFIEMKETKNTVVSDIIVSRTTGEDCIIIAHPILIDDTFKGAVFTAILVDEFIELAALNSDTHEGYHTYITAPSLDSFIAKPINNHYLELSRMAAADTDTIYYYPSKTGIYAVSFEIEPFTGWHIVTELNMVVYYSDIWLFMIIFIVTLFISLILVIFELSKKHNQELIPLIENLKTDDLTGIGNRGYFEYEVKNWLDGNHSGVFIILDLDHFKKVNDFLGHNEGDRLLIETAQILQTIFRKGDIIARLGGDEFVIFLTNTAELSVIKRRVGEMLKQIAKT
ncbi:MAG: sensor domain-containing diguanylate cyclase, partial [Culicoidibacterales bacterium]